MLVQRASPQGAGSYAEQGLAISRVLRTSVPFLGFSNFEISSHNNFGKIRLWHANGVGRPGRTTTRPLRLFGKDSGRTHPGQPRLIEIANLIFSSSDTADGKLPPPARAHLPAE